MATTIKVTRRGHAAAGRRERRDALRVSGELVGRMHHRLYKMLKFSDAAVKRYGLVPRSGEPGSGHRFQGSYTEAKVQRRVNGQGSRAIGETKPFVWSGGSRASARASRKVVAKAQSAERGSVEVIVVAPALNLRPKGARMNPREEFERIAEIERAEQEKRGLARYDKALADTRSKTHVARG